jgi:hypothetical protein
MDITDLQSIASEAEKTLDTLGICVLVASAAVVIGLAIEYIPEIKRIDRRQPNPDLLQGVIGGIVVTVAIAAELGFQFWASRTETTLRTTNHQIVALMSTRASALEKETETLRQSNIEAQKELETERTERLKLQKRFSWRHLNDDRLKRIGIAILPFHKMPFDCEIADAESFNFLNDLSRVLMAAQIGWILKPWVGRIVLRTSDGTPIGIFIGSKFTITYGVARKDDFGPAGKALASALVAEGIEAVAEDEPSETGTSSDQRIHINIGSKPAF